MKLNKTLVIAAASLLGISMTSMAQAGGAELFQTKTCWSCHGKDAKTPILPIYPKLAGQNEAYLLNQMKDIKSGARNNGQTAAMKGVMGMVNEAEMAEIAKWLASQK